MALTVRELIDQLSELPVEALDLPVYADGCDCTGEANSIEVSPGEVLISRAKPPKRIRETDRVREIREEEMLYARARADEGGRTTISRAEGEIAQRLVERGRGRVAPGPNGAIFTASVPDYGVEF